MHIVTSQKLIDKYGPSVIDIVKQLSPNVDVLPTNDYASVKAHCDTINDSILLFGGNDIIPHQIVLCPSAGPDTSIATDNGYACTQDLSGLVPDKIVTRLPDEQINGKIDFIQSMVNTQVQLMQNTIPNNGFFNIVASVWNGISTYVNTTFNMNNENISPPITSATLSNTEYANKKYAFINLHGAMFNPGNFYGQFMSSYPIAIQPTPGMFNGTLVFSEACYGAYLEGRDRTTSIALANLCTGCVGFVGSSRVAYGSSNAPGACADILGIKFLTRILNHESIGSAFLNAKKDYIADTIRTQGMLDPEAKTTILEFLCYGLPDLIIK